MTKFAILTAATAMTLGVGATQIATAQTATRAPAASPAQRTAGCVGSWQLSIYEQPGEAPLRALVQMGSDHSLIFGETSAITSLTPGVPVEYTSLGIGRWSGSGRKCAYRLLVNAADATGKPTRTSDIRGTLTVAPNGRTFAGPLTITVIHADGSRNAFTTRASAARIGVLPAHVAPR